MYKSYATWAMLSDPGYIGTVSTNQSALLRMLETASETIDRICHRHFNTWEGIQYFDGVARVLVPDEDILSITEIDLDQDGSQTYSKTLATSDYLVYPLSGPQLFPKYMIKLPINTSVGSLASSIPAGIKITGVFGYGNGLSATPYSDSGDSVQDNPMTISQSTLTVTNPGGNTFSPGQTLRIGSEQMYVTAVLGTTVNVVRGVNGTTATSHIKTTEIYIYQYPSPVVDETLLLATAIWKQRENPAAYMSGSTATGTYTITKDAEKLTADRLWSYIKRKLS